MRMESYIGYHATSNEAAQNILKTNFYFTKKGWFGTGAYFYLDSIKLAEHWLEKKKFENKQIIKVQIEVEKEFILDVRNPYSEDCIFFHKMREIVKKNIINNSINLNTSQRNFDNSVFNFIIKRAMKKLIIGNSFTYDNDEIICFSRVPNGTELCVSDLDIIKKKEVIFNE